jgi:hypothetical protein
MSINLNERGTHERDYYGGDLAKEVIAVCGADRSGKTVLMRVFRRDAFACSPQIFDPGRTDPVARLSLSCVMIAA